MPVAESQYIVVIAKATGWAESFIRWDLPLARGWSYFHSAMLLSGVAMTIPGGDHEDRTWWSGVKEKLSRVAGRFNPTK
jgi:hypothetical protein